MSEGKDFVWTDERHAQLHDMIVVEGLTSAACAWKFGVSRNAIIGKARRLGFDFRNGGKHDARPRKVVLAPAATVARVVIKAKPAGFGAGAVAAPRVEKSTEQAKRTAVNNQNRAMSQRINAKLVGEQSNQAPLSDRFAEGFMGQQGRVALVDLQPQHCRWPIETPGGETRYCGCAKLDERSYCAQHYARSIAKNVPAAAVPKSIPSGGPRFDYANY